MDKYKKRIADDILARKLAGKGAVVIQGPKWCGKTTTAEVAAKSILYMDNPKTMKQNLLRSETDPETLLEGDKPRLIDEWQIAPKLWDTIRFTVDHEGKFGLFILTGSAVPSKTDEIQHSGTGRFTWIKMRPMSLFESGESNGAVSIEELFKNTDVVVRGESSLSLKDIAFLICRGGWPMALDYEEDIALQQAVDYYDAIINDDISRVDGIKRDAGFVKRLLRSYARNQGTQVSIGTIIEDMGGNGVSDPCDKTAAQYISSLKKIFVIEDAESWNPNLRSKTAIRTSDTRYFVDSSVAAAALGIGPGDLLEDLNTMGLLFETMAIRDLRVYTDALDGEVYHYRDRSGLECDAVIHLRNGAYGLIEIKLGGDSLIEEGVESLTKLANKIDTKKMKSPSFLMVLTATGDSAYKRSDGVLVVPIGCLKQ